MSVSPAALGYSNVIPNVKDVVGDTTFTTDGITNEIELAALPLKNIRGVVVFTFVASDDPPGTSATARFIGGYGTFPTDPTQNWGAKITEAVRCTVTSTALNTFVVTTTAPQVVREYTIQFFPYVSSPPLIEQTGGVPLGASTLTVTQAKKTFGYFT